MAALIGTDKPDYAPGETVQITASGFGADQPVIFQVTRIDPPADGELPGDGPWVVVDNNAPFNVDPDGDGTANWTVLNDLDDAPDAISTNWAVTTEYLNSTLMLTADGGFHTADTSDDIHAEMTFTDSNEDYKHFANKAPVSWVNGALGSSNSTYFEGEAVPHYFVTKNLTIGAAYAFNVYYDYSKVQSGVTTGGISALDGYNADYSPPLVPGGLPVVADLTEATEGGGYVYVAGADITDLGSPVTVVGSGQSQRYVTVQFTATTATAEFYWGLELALPGAVGPAAQGVSNWPGASPQSSVATTPAVGGGVVMVGGGGNMQINPSAVVSGNIVGVKFNDLNGDGDRDAGEPGLAGWSVQVYEDDGDNVFEPGAGDPLVTTPVTIADGTYTTTSLFPGSYFVREVQQAGWVQTSNPIVFLATITAAVPDVTNINFGNRVLVQQTLSGFKFNDQDNNGVFDAGEPKLPGWQIYIDSNNDSTLAWTDGGSLNGIWDPGEGEQWVTTAADGSYAFVTPDIGTYIIRETPQAGWTQTNPTGGTNAGAYTVSLGIGPTVSVSPTATASTLDFGNFYANPSLTIVKSLTNANDAVIDMAGETIEYTIVVDNTGNVDLTTVVLGDVFAGGATLTGGDLNDNDILETTETWTYTADYTVTQANLNAGTNLVNVATVNTDQTNEQQDDATSTVDQNPSLTIVKSLTNANDAVIDMAGETIEYTIVVDNTGNVDLTTVVLGDVFAGGATLTGGDLNDNDILETTETWTYTADYTVTQANLNAGTNLVNVATVNTDQTNEQQDDATSTVDQNPSLTIVKSLTNANDAVIDMAGETIEYTIVVDNTGNVDLTTVVLGDVFAGGATLTGGDLNDNDILETTETWTYTADYTVTQANLNAGTNLVNVATVNTDQTNEQQDDATSTVDQNPSLTIVKSLTNANDAVIDMAGETIEYTIVVDNTGNVDLTTVVLGDVFAGGATLTGGDLNDNDILETTETWTYTADYTVTQANLNAGTNLVNVATVNTDQTNEQQDDATSTVDQNPSLTIVKSLTNANDAVIDMAGETIEYTIVVDNTGNVDLTTVVLGDVFAGGATLTGGDLNDNDILETTETWTYTADYTVTQANLNAGTNLVNVATVNTDQTNEQQDDATSTVDQNPSLTIVKSLTNANDAVIDMAGETIEYTIVVDNTGNVDLTTVVLGDVFAGGATLTGGDLNDNDILETTETWTYTADYTVTQANLNAGTNLVNVATVNTDQTNEQQDDATSTVDQNPSLTIVKSLTNANDAVIDMAGETIEYTIVVDNTGNVDLTTVVLGDVFAGGATLTGGDLNDNDILETTETWTYTADYTVTQANLNAGTNLVNVATVNTDQTNEQQDDATSTVDQNPSLTIVKSLTNANDAVIDMAGETIEYTIVVDNTGNVDLTTVVLGDVFAGGATLTGGDLNDNDILETTETWTYTADYTVTQANLNAGTNLVNVATVNTDQTNEQQDDATSTVDQNPSLTIVKSLTNANDAVIDMAGETIEYTIVVDNTGNVDLTTVVLGDVFAGGATLTGGDLNDNDILETTETWTYTADYTVTQANLNAGTNLVNVATVNTDQTNEQQDDATSTVDQNPSLTIVKSLTNANDAVIDMAGETIEYTIVVDNTGNVDLTTVVLGDVFAGGATLTGGDLNDNDILETTETWTYTADYTVTQANLNAGTNLVNVATVNTDQTNEQQDDATSTVDQNPSLTIVKSLTNANDAVIDMAGETIEYTIVVDNTGNVDLTTVVLGDVFAGGATLTGGDLNDNDILETTETWTYTADYTVTQANLNAGTNLVNVATVNTDQTNEQQDDATSTVDQNPSLTIVKSLTNANDAVIDMAGETIEYTIVVDNTGNVDLTTVVLGDVFAGGATLTGGDLNDNDILETTETWTYTADYTVTQANLNAGTNLVNVATVNTDQTNEQQDDATSTVDQNPLLSIVKTTADDYGNEGDGIGVLPGNNVTWNYLVENTGNVTLYNVTVTDDLEGSVLLVGLTDEDGDLVEDDLAVGATATGSVSGNAISDWYYNVGTADADDPLEAPVTASDTSSYYGLTPGVVTNSSLCDFGTTFDLVFTPDLKNWGTTPHYKLSDSNPGQFYYNVFFTPADIGDGDDIFEATDTITLNIPYPFVTQGANPVHAYSGVFVDSTDGSVCFDPTGELYSWGTDGLIKTRNTAGTALTLNLGALADHQFVYLNIHLDYALEKANGWKRSGENAINDPAVNPSLTGINILEPTTHAFSSTIEGTNDNDSIQNNNEFKSIKGFGGLVELKGSSYAVDGDTIPVEGAVVRLYKDATYLQLLDTATTDQHGWYYMQNFQHKGKAATYYLELQVDTDATDGITYAQVRTATTIGGSDKFGEGYFLIDDTTAAPGLHVAGGPNPGVQLGADVTQSMLAPIVSAAIEYWAALGVGGEDLESLATTAIQIENLGGSLLGKTDGSIVWLDDDAAGHGWSESLAAVDSGEVDLLSVVTHEFGHLLGYGHDLLGIDELSPGVRFMPQLLSVFADRRDVSGDGQVSPLDAVLLINYLNSRSNKVTDGSDAEGEALDVNEDGGVTPLDAVLIINYLNGDGATKTDEMEATDSYFRSLASDDDARAYGILSLLATNSTDQPAKKKK